MTDEAKRAERLKAIEVPRGCVEIGIATQLLLPLDVQGAVNQDA